VHTIKTHMKHIYAKLDAHNRLEAVRRARENGLLGLASPHPASAN
jgi:LuxR family maltose regulon positive regulatory protein